jgi:mannose-6-phosphate isomerase
MNAVASICHLEYDGWMEPLTFTPIYLEHVWGGRELERIYGRQLPKPDRVYGESWEIVDRDPEQSVVEGGELGGLTLHELWVRRRAEVFGEGFEDTPRFPLLLKVLDASDVLSLQVHPPVEAIARFGGEPKAEMWHITDCKPGAKLFVGIKAGVTRGVFEAAIRGGAVSGCVHELTPKPGESIFIHMGRLHAIGAGFLIHEIQQNSDTTYRVFDWDRLGLDGKPRRLHITESLASIDFDDHEPTMDAPVGDTLVACRYFKTTRQELAIGAAIGNPEAGCFSILVVLSGCLQSVAGRRFAKGQSLLLPREAKPLCAVQESIVLQVTLPRAGQG